MNTVDQEKQFVSNEYSKHVPLSKSPLPYSSNYSIHSKYLHAGERSILPDRLASRFPNVREAVPKC